MPRGQWKCIAIAAHRRRSASKRVWNAAWETMEFHWFFLGCKACPIRLFAEEVKLEPLKYFYCQFLRKTAETFVIWNINPSFREMGSINKNRVIIKKLLIAIYSHGFDNEANLETREMALFQIWYKVWGILRGTKRVEWGLILFSKRLL